MRKARRTWRAFRMRTGTQTEMPTPPLVSAP
jgi:hypothetical protein